MQGVFRYIIVSVFMFTTLFPGSLAFALMDDCHSHTLSYCDKHDYRHLLVTSDHADLDIVLNVSDSHEQHESCEHHIDDETDVSIRGPQCKLDVAKILAVTNIALFITLKRSPPLCRFQVPDTYFESQSLQSLRTIRLLI